MRQMMGMMMDASGGKKGKRGGYRLLVCCLVLREITGESGKYNI